MPRLSNACRRWHLALWLRVTALVWHFPHTYVLAPSLSSPPASSARGALPLILRRDLLLTRQGCTKAELLAVDDQNGRAYSPAQPPPSSAAANCSQHAGRRDAQRRVGLLAFVVLQARS